MHDFPTAFLCPIALVYSLCVLPTLLFFTQSLHVAFVLQRLISIWLVAGARFWGFAGSLIFLHHDLILNHTDIRQYYTIFDELVLHAFAVINHLAWPVSGFYTLGWKSHFLCFLHCWKQMILESLRISSHPQRIYWYPQSAKNWALHVQTDNIVNCLQRLLSLYSNWSTIPVKLPSAYE